MHKTPIHLLATILPACAVAVVISISCPGCSKPQENHVPGKGPLTLTTENFRAEVINSPVPVLVDFWASWCGPCKVIAPTVAELAVEFEGKVKVGKVDVDAETELAQKYNITGIPALLIFKGGKVVDRMIGVREKSEIASALTKFAATISPEKSTKKL